MEHAAFRTGMRVVYKRDTSREMSYTAALEGCTGTVNVSLDCQSNNCVGVAWDNGRRYGAYPWNLRLLEGRNSI